MEQYTVTVTRDGGDGSEPESRPQMTARVEVENGRAHVVELNMRAPTGADITSAALPPVDLERLAQAFGNTVPGPETPVAEPRTESERPVKPAGRPERQRPARTRRHTARQSGGTAPSLPGARAYRKTPDPEELQRVYQEAGSIVGVAKHYDVPTHTAQGWIGRLRKRGVSS